MQSSPSTDQPVCRHTCLIYSGAPSEQLPVVIPFIREGLSERWRCLYLGDPAMVQMVDTALGAQGIDTTFEIRRGALVLSSTREHLADGVFDPSKMVDSVCTSADKALDDGYTGLCATGDMRWELGAPHNVERLLGYEALIEQALRDRPLRGLCQYHRDLMPEHAVRYALMTHREAHIGNVHTKDNLFYMPPELLLDTSAGAAAHAAWMCQQILRIQRTESVRDDTLQALRKNEAEQRALAKQLADINRSLEQRVTTRTAELQLANEHLEAFSHSVSHDLRGPLRIIHSFSELLVQDFAELLGEEGKRRLGRIVANAEHMDDLIQGLLTLTKVMRANIRGVVLDLSGLARTIMAELRGTAPQRPVSFVVDEGLVAFGDPTLVRVLLTNLLGNAWKYTSKNTDARIELRHVPQEKSGRTFMVRDNGVGFDRVRAGNPFRMFQRLHAQAEFAGTGVGLAAVERIISRHGGKIWAESHPGQGATFFFTLPTPTADLKTSAPRIERSYPS